MNISQLFIPNFSSDFSFLIYFANPVFLSCLSSSCVASVSSLQTLCRKAIQKHIVHRMAIDWLELPEALKHYCKYEWRIWTGNEQKQHLWALYHHFVPRISFPWCFINKVKLTGLYTWYMPSTEKTYILCNDNKTEINSQYCTSLSVCFNFPSQYVCVC